MYIFIVIYVVICFYFKQSLFLLFLITFYLIELMYTIIIPERIDIYYGFESFYIFIFLDVFFICCFCIFSEAIPL